MSQPDDLREAALVRGLVIGLALAACSVTPSPTPQPTPTAIPLPSPSPSPTAVPPVAFPLAAVTGYTNLKADTTSAELLAMARDGSLVLPCGLVEVLGIAVSADAACTDATAIAGLLAADQKRLALLPPGLVEPKTKVLPVDGADLFGGPAARALAYPVIGRTIKLPAPWVSYNAADIRTIVSLGDSCPDRGVAYQAITLNKGWAWVFGGGRVRYLRIYPNPTPFGTVGNGFNIVDAVPIGDQGAVARLVSGADITLDDFECPVVQNWTVNDALSFSIDPAVLPHLRDDYGVDVVTLAENHVFDRGTAGFLETLQRFAAAGIQQTGAGADLNAALTPAVVVRNGLRFAFVGFNDVPGPQAAAPGVPGVAWLNEANIRAGVSRARAAADVVICIPQWWGGYEYHNDFTASEVQQQALFYDAGCDQILGHGTHCTGPLNFTTDASGAIHFTIGSHGNFLFGQGWSQQTSEGVIVELAFRGTRLVQARMHPYFVLDQAQVNLTDPQSDGRYVLQRIYENNQTSC